MAFDQTPNSGFNIALLGDIPPGPAVAKLHFARRQIAPHTRIGVGIASLQGAQIALFDTNTNLSPATSLTSMLAELEEQLEAHSAESSLIVVHTEFSDAALHRCATGLDMVRDTDGVWLGKTVTGTPLAIKRAIWRTDLSDPTAVVDAWRQAPFLDDQTSAVLGELSLAPTAMHPDQVPAQDSPLVLQATQMIDCAQDFSHSEQPAPSLWAKVTGAARSLFAGA